MGLNRFTKRQYRSFIDMKTCGIISYRQGIRIIEEHNCFLTVIAKPQQSTWLWFGIFSMGIEHLYMNIVDKVVGYSV